MIKEAVQENKMEIERNQLILDTYNAMYQFLYKYFNNNTAEDLANRFNQIKDNSSSDKSELLNRFLIEDHDDFNNYEQSHGFIYYIGLINILNYFLEYEEKNLNNQISFNNKNELIEKMNDDLATNR